MQQDLSLPTLISLYLDALEAEGKTAKTITAYRESLQMYLRIADREGLPLVAGAITPADVYRYIAAVRRRGVCDATQHRRHREMKHFFSWLKRLDLVPENPFQKVPLIRLEQKIVRPFTEDEVRTILDACDPTTLLGARNRAITLFLLDTGVRASELTSLDVDDLDLDSGRARILHGKGRKQRVIAFSQPVAEAVRAYLGLRAANSGPLFQTKQGNRMKSQGLILIYQRLSKATGIPHIHAHRFRHTFATMAIRSAAREIDVQHLLGHSTSAMVRRYTRTYDAEQAALAHASFSPVASLGLAGREARQPKRLPSRPFPPAPSPSRLKQGQATLPIRDRTLVLGTRLVATYKGRRYEAEVTGSDRGDSYRLADGRCFSSLSAAGRAVMGGVACNGWRFWRVAQEDLAVTRSPAWLTEDSDTR